MTIFRLILFYRVHKLTRLQKRIVYGGEPLQVYFKRACVKAYLYLSGHLYACHNLNPSLNCRIRYLFEKHILVEHSTDSTYMYLHFLILSNSLAVLQFLLKSVSMRRPGRTRQGVIMLKSPISLKLGTNVRYQELTYVKECQVQILNSLGDPGSPCKNRHFARFMHN